MSLDWDTTRLVDRPLHFPGDEDGRMNNGLHSLIWLTMAVGIGQITEENADAFWHRADIWQKAIGAQLQVSVETDGHHAWTPYYVTKEQVLHAVGLHTNASPKSKTAFLKDMYSTHERFQS